MYIYKITNKINGKCYIGQTINSINSRFNKHCSESSGCYAISAAIQKYGREFFDIEEIDGANSQSELNYKEWLLIFNHNTLAPNGYNLREGGGAKGKMTNILKAKLSKIKKGKPNLMKGKKHTKQSKLNMSMGSLGQIGGMKNKKHTKKSNIKNALSNGGNFFNMIKGNEVVWSGYIISECAREFSLSIGNISECLRGNRKTHKGYTFKYKDKDNYDSSER